MGILADYKDYQDLIDKMYPSTPAYSKEGLKSILGSALAGIIAKGLTGSDTFASGLVKGGTMAGLDLIKRAEDVKQIADTRKMWLVNDAVANIVRMDMQKKLADIRNQEEANRVKMFTKELDNLLANKDQIEPHYFPIKVLSLASKYNIPDTYLRGALQTAKSIATRNDIERIVPMDQGDKISVVAFTRSGQAIPLRVYSKTISPNIKYQYDELKEQRKQQIIEKRTDSGLKFIRDYFLKFINQNDLASLGFGPNQPVTDDVAEAVLSGSPKTGSEYQKAVERYLDLVEKEQDKLLTNTGYSKRLALKAIKEAVMGKDYTVKTDNNTTNMDDLILKGIRAFRGKR